MIRNSSPTKTSDSSDRNDLTPLGASRALLGPRESGKCGRVEARRLMTGSVLVSGGYTNERDRLTEGEPDGLPYSGHTRGMARRAP
jgi:hypothetical protein